MSPLLIDSPPDLLVILFVVVLIFGGKKLPELARGTGRALRIFKTEISGLDDDDQSAPASPRTELEAKQAAERAELEARHEAERQRHQQQS